MGRPLDEDQVDRLMTALRALSGAAGNYTLIEKLDWNEEEYWRIRDKAIARGLVVRGRGRGGSVSVVPEVTEKPTPVAAAPTVQSAQKDRARESDLYGPCRKVLQSAWSEERGLQDCHIEI